MQHTNHSDHDVLLIAAHAAGDTTDADRSRAQALLDTCQSCTELHRDLLAISAATRSLPNLAAAPRTFQLTAEQAARLQRGSWLRTVLAPFSGARSAVRPVAAAFTSLGVAGLLVATLLPGALGSAGSLAPQRNRSSTGDIAAPAAAPSIASVAGGPVASTGAGYPDTRPLAAGGRTTAPGVTFGGAKDASASAAPEVAVANAASSAPGMEADDAGRMTTGGNAPSPIFIGSVALLGLGLLLFGLRFAGRRLR